jgi:hypothetical protein
MDYMPMATGKSSMGGWSKNKKPTKQSKVRNTHGKYVGFS